MASYLSAGVFIEEVPSQVQVVQAVSTSNYGICGFTMRGPVNTPTLVTSYDQYTRIFGGLSSDSLTPLSMAAYFTNGGQRAYVVRVVPADAVSSDAKIHSVEHDQTVATGDGTVVAQTGTNLEVDSGTTPVVPYSLTFRWREDATPVTAEALYERDGVTAVAGDGSEVDFEARVVTSMPSVIDEALPSIAGVVAGTNIDFTTGAAPGTIALTTLSGLVLTGTNAAGSTASLDLVSGFCSLSFYSTEIPDAATAITIDYTPCTAVKSCTDAVAGVLSGDVAAPGTVDYDAGSWSFTTSAAASNGCPVLAEYKIDAWDINPISAGAWGDSLRVTVQGNEDYYTAATGQYTRFDVFVQLYNSSTLTYAVVDQLEELSFDDSADSKYFPDVVNDLSDYITVTDPGGDVAPGQLQTTSHSRVIAAGGDGTATGVPVITATLGHTSVQPRTVSIAYTSGSVARTVTDDGSGNLIGDINASGTNTISYTTGALNVTLVGAPDANTFVRVSYGEAPSASLNADLGDQTEYTWTGAAAALWTAGSNGTFDSSNYGRNQVSVPTLEASKSGIYALNSVQDLLNVGVVDFAGDVTIMGDILDHVDARALLPSGADRFAILNTTSGLTAQEARDWLRYTLNRSSANAAIYWPWVKVRDPLLDNREVTMPGISHIAGIYARTDQTRDVSKSPAGTVDGQLRFISGLESVSTMAERDIVYPAKINPLVESPETGLAVWGARTLSSLSEWRYISTRRLFNFVERSVYNATHWVVFENNGPNLWTRIKAQLDGFLLQMYNDGLFAGTSPTSAFSVVVDSTNNTSESIDAGQVIIDVGIAPNKPGEFIRFRFKQLTISS